MQIFILGSALVGVALASRLFGSYPLCTDGPGCMEGNVGSGYLGSRYIDEHLPRMPVLGLGTAGLGGSGYSIVCHALRSGMYRLIDTAQAREWYDETSVGKALRDCGGQNISNTIVVTKIHPRDYEPGPMRAAVLKSITTLCGDQRGSLDVALLHTTACWAGHCTPEQQRYPWLSAWKNLEELYSAGLVKAIGVSNVNAQQLMTLIHSASFQVSVVQNWMDPLHQDIEVRRICESYDIAYMAFSSFGTQWGARPSPHNSRVMQNPVLNHPVLVDMASRYDRSVAAVIISWAIQEGAIVIPKTSKADHVDDNARVLTASPSGDAISPPKLTTFLTFRDIAIIRALDGSLEK